MALSQAEVDRLYAEMTGGSNAPSNTNNKLSNEQVSQLYDKLTGQQQQAYDPNSLYAMYSQAPQTIAPDVQAPQKEGGILSYLGHGIADLAEGHASVQRMNAMKEQAEGAASDAATDFADAERAQRLANWLRPEEYKQAESMLGRVGQGAVRSVPFSLSSMAASTPLVVGGGAIGGALGGPIGAALGSGAGSILGGLLSSYHESSQEQADAFHKLVNEKGMEAKAAYDKTQKEVFYPNMAITTLTDSIFNMVTLGASKTIKGVLGTKAGKELVGEVGEKGAKSIVSNIFKAAKPTSAKLAGEAVETTSESAAKQMAKNSIMRQAWNMAKTYAPKAAILAGPEATEEGLQLYVGSRATGDTPSVREYAENMGAGGLGGVMMGGAFNAGDRFVSRDKNKTNANVAAVTPAAMQEAQAAAQPAPAVQPAPTAPVSPNQGNVQGNTQVDYNQQTEQIDRYVAGIDSTIATLNNELANSKDSDTRNTLSGMIEEYDNLRNRLNNAKALDGNSGSRTTAVNLVGANLQSIDNQVSELMNPAAPQVNEVAAPTEPVASAVNVKKSRGKKQQAVVAEQPAPVVSAPTNTGLVVEQPQITAQAEEQNDVVAPTNEEAPLSNEEFDAQQRKTDELLLNTADELEKLGDVDRAEEIRKQVRTQQTKEKMAAAKAKRDAGIADMVSNSVNELVGGTADNEAATTESAADVNGVEADVPIGSVQDVENNIDSIRRMRDELRRKVDKGYGGEGLNDNMMSDELDRLDNAISEYEKGNVEEALRILRRTKSLSKDENGNVLYNKKDNTEGIKSIQDDIQAHQRIITASDKAAEKLKKSIEKGDFNKLEDAQGVVLNDKTGEQMAALQKEINASEMELNALEGRAANEKKNAGERGYELDKAGAVKRQRDISKLKAQLKAKLEEQKAANEFRKANPNKKKRDALIKIARDYVEYDRLQKEKDTYNKSLNRLQEKLASLNESNGIDDTDNPIIEDMEESFILPGRYTRQDNSAQFIQEQGYDNREQGRPEFPLSDGKGFASLNEANKARREYEAYIKAKVENPIRRIIERLNSMTGNRRAQGLAKRLSEIVNPSDTIKVESRGGGEAAKIETISDRIFDFLIKKYPDKYKKQGERLVNSGEAKNPVYWVNPKAKRVDWANKPQSVEKSDVRYKEAAPSKIGSDRTLQQIYKDISNALKKNSAITGEFRSVMEDLDSIFNSNNTGSLFQEFRAVRNAWDVEHEKAEAARSDMTDRNKNYGKSTFAEKVAARAAEKTNATESATVRSKRDGISAGENNKINDGIIEKYKNNRLNAVERLTAKEKDYKNSKKQLPEEDKKMLSKLRAVNTLLEKGSNRGSVIGRLNGVDMRTLNDYAKEYSSSNKEYVENTGELPAEAVLVNKKKSIADKKTAADVPGGVQEKEASAPDVTQSENIRRGKAAEVVEEAGKEVQKKQSKIEKDGTLVSVDTLSGEKGAALKKDIDMVMQGREKLLGDKLKDDGLSEEKMASIKAELKEVKAIRAAIEKGVAKDVVDSVAGTTYDHGYTTPFYGDLGESMAADGKQGRNPARVVAKLESKEVPHVLPSNLSAKEIKAANEGTVDVGQTGPTEKSAAPKPLNKKKVLTEDSLYNKETHDAFEESMNALLAKSKSGKVTNISVADKNRKEARIKKIPEILAKLKDGKYEEVLKLVDRYSFIGLDGWSVQSKEEGEAEKLTKKASVSTNESTDSSLFEFTKDNVQKLFGKKSRVRENGEGGFTVSLPKGKTVTITEGGNIVLSDKAIEAAYGKSVAEAVGRGERHAVGAFDVVDGVPLIELLRGEANDFTANHELFHYAAAMALDKGQWQTLVNKFGLGNLSAERQEEALADRFAEFRDGRLKASPMIKSIMRRIADFFKNIRSWVSGQQNAEDIFRAIESGDVWNQEAGDNFSGSKYQLSSEEGGIEQMSRSDKKNETFTSQAGKLFDKEHRKSLMQTLGDHFMREVVDDKWMVRRYFGKNVHSELEHGLAGMAARVEYFLNKNLAPVLGKIDKRDSTDFSNYVGWMRLRDVAGRNEYINGQTAALRALAKDSYDEAKKIRSELNAKRGVFGSDEIKEHEADIKLHKKIGDGYAKEARELAGGKRRILGSSAEYQKNIDAVLKNHPEFKDAQKQLVKVSEKILDILVNSGVVSREAKEKMMAAHPNYVPLTRDLGENDSLDTFAQKFNAGILDVRNPIKKFVGSNKNFVDPVAQIAVNLNKAMRIEARQKAVNEIVNNYNDGKLDGIIRKADEKTQMRKDETEFWAYENGKKERYLVPKDVAEFITDFNGTADNEAMITRFLRIPGDVLRSGVTKSPAFFLPNLVSDSFHSAIVNPGVRPIIDSVRGVFMLWNKGKEFDSWLEHGGKQGFYRGSIEQVQGDTDAMYANYDSVNENKPGWMGRLMNKLEEISEFSENATRLGSYQRMVELGINPDEAGWRTVDQMWFGRGGRSAKWLNRVVPFSNASIQGTYSLVKNLFPTDQNGKWDRGASERAGLRALMYITLPSIILSMINLDDDDKREKYEKIPQWQKNTYWNYVVGDEIIKIPKPHSAGVLFGSLAERAIDYMYSEDKRAFDDFKNTFFGTVAPEFIPLALKVPVEIMANYNLRTGRPIVPASEQKLAARDQYGPYTSDTAVMVSDWFQRATGHTISPRKLEYLAGSTGGNLARDALKAMDAGIRAASGKELPTRDWYDFPIGGNAVKRFVTNERNMKRHEQDFRDELDDITKELNSAVADAKNTPRRDMPEEQQKLLGSKNSIESLRARELKAVSDLQREIKEITKDSRMSGDRKRQLIDKRTDKIERISKQALNKLDKIKERL